MTWEEFQAIIEVGGVYPYYRNKYDGLFIQGLRLDQLQEIFRLAEDALRSATAIDFQI
jgi:hypothetical protein